MTVFKWCIRKKGSATSGWRGVGGKTNLSRWADVGGRRGRCSELPPVPPLPRGSTTPTLSGLSPSRSRLRPSPGVSESNCSILQVGKFCTRTFLALDFGVLFSRVNLAVDFFRTCANFCGCRSCCNDSRSFTLWSHQKKEETLLRGRSCEEQFFLCLYRRKIKALIARLSLSDPGRPPLHPGNSRLPLVLGVEAKMVRVGSRAFKSRLSLWRDSIYPAPQLLPKDLLVSLVSCSFNCSKHHFQRGCGFHRAFHFKSRFCCIIEHCELNHTKQRLNA